MNPHQKDPNDVNNKPLLKSLFIVNFKKSIIHTVNRLFYC